MSVKIAIIGGSGAYDPSMFKVEEEVTPGTPYGNPSAPILIGELAGVKVAFLERHGQGHVYPPHMVPYRANLWALKELGVEHIISTSTCGSLKEGLHPGELVVLDQFVDFTKDRKYSFYNQGATYHISVAEPFCKDLRELFYIEGERLGLPIHQEGTYACIEGPRFSTKAESKMFQDYADVVGMTLVPEAPLARELEMCYVNISMITDYDVWKEHVVSIQDIISVMQKNLGQVRSLLESTLPKILTGCRKCECAKALENAKA